MKGSETETSTQKLLHDTYTDWVRRIASSFQYFEPGGASEYAQNMRSNYARDKANG